MVAKKTIHEHKHQYAGFWMRFIAYIIDMAVLSVVASGLSVLLFLMKTAGTFSGIFILGITWLYYAFMESSEYQGTLGKLAVGIQVTDLSGKTIDFSQATGRFFGKFLSALILFIGFIMIAFTKQKQGLHDIISGCLVVERE